MTEQLNNNANSILANVLIPHLDLSGDAPGTSVLSFVP